MKILVCTAVAGALALGAGLPLSAYAQEGPPGQQYQQREMMGQPYQHREMMRGQNEMNEPNEQQNVRVIHPANLSHRAVAEIQNRLARNGFYQGPINGYWTEESIVALTHFQNAHGIRETGELTTPTLMALNLNPHRLLNEGPPAG